MVMVDKIQYQISHASLESPKFKVLVDQMEMQDTDTGRLLHEEFPLEKLQSRLPDDLDGELPPSPLPLNEYGLHAVEVVAGLPVSISFV